MPLKPKDKFRKKTPLVLVQIKLGQEERPRWKGKMDNSSLEDPGTMLRKTSPKSNIQKRGMIFNQVFLMCSRQIKQKKKEY